MAERVAFARPSGRARPIRRQFARPTVRTTYQLAARLSPKEGQSLDEAWTEAIKTTCGWLRDRSPSRHLPQEAWEGLDFECGVPGHRVEAAAVPDEGLCAVGRAYVSQPFPVDTAVPAMDAGLGLGLLADLYDITGDAAWIDGANGLAETLLPVYFDERALPRGAAGIDWYESQMGPGFLLHGLARRALLGKGCESCPLTADYTAR